MSKQLGNVLSQIYDVPWFITKEGMENILSIIDRKLAGESLSEEELNFFKERSEEDRKLSIPDKPSVAVLNINGPIFPKASLMTALSGATSVDQLKSDFMTLMESDMVTGVVLNIDSPGGSAFMIKEMADTIHTMREKRIKPIYAVANPVAASAAYYLGSQADKFFMTPSGIVGSLGVIMVHTESSEKDKKEGINRTILTVGKYKADGNPYEPLSDSAKDHMIASMQETYDEFVSDVARGRGTDVENVVENFGQGRAYKARTSIKKGMVDGIETLESVVGSMTKQESSSGTVLPIAAHSPKGVEKMDRLTPETLEALGLSEEATPEDIHNAVVSIKEATVVPEDKPELSLVDDPDFAEKYPEVAAKLRKQDERIASLVSSETANKAKLFAAEYERFADSTEGLSGVGLEIVRDVHLKISDGLMTHTDLKTMLDKIADNKFTVNYGELGSKRGKEPVDTSDALAAATQLKELALERAAEKGMSYGDALVEVGNENEELWEAWRGSRPIRDGGGEN